MWLEFEGLKKKRKGLILSLLGCIALISLGLIVGSVISVGYLDLMIKANIVYFTYLSLIAIAFGVALIDQLASNIVAKTSLAILLIGFILMFVGISIYSYIGQLLIVISLATLIATSIPPSSLIKPVKSKIVLLGLSFKSTSVTLAVLWIIHKLIISFTILNYMFGGGDFTFYLMALSYIAGSLIETMGTYYELEGINAALKNGSLSAFISTLIMIIVTYILRKLNILTASWDIYVSNLIQILAMSLIATVLLYVTSTGLSQTMISEEKRRIVEGETYVLEGNEEIDVGENVHFFAEKGTIITKISADVMNKKLEGIYFVGFGTYRVKSDGIKLVGSFDKGWIIYTDPEKLQELWRRLRKRKATTIDLNRVGFRSEEDFQEFLTEEVEKVSEKISKKTQRTHIKLPFLEIIESPGYDYVKIGPLVVMDSPGYTVVKIGPFKIVDSEAGISSKLPKYLKRKKMGLEALIGVHDTERGNVDIAVYPNRVEIESNETNIRAQKNELEITTETSKLKIVGNTVKITTPTVVLKATKGKNAKLVVTNGPTIKADINGEVKIVKGIRVIKTHDKNLAKKVIDKIYTTGEKIVKRKIERDQVSELEDLIKYLEKLLD